MKRTIYPYPTLAADLELNLANVFLDGTEIKTEFVMSSDRVLDVNEAAIENWEQLTFDVKVQSHKETVIGFEKDHGDLSLTLVASCRPTNVRQRVDLERSNDDPSLWSGTVNLDRSCFYGKVNLQALLTCEMKGDLPKQVGFSDSWAIYFDASDSFKVSGSLKVSWYDFKSFKAPAIARQFPNAPYVVDLEQPLPEIYLNESFEGLEPLLRDSKERSSIEQVLHDTTRMSIARSVWLTLVNDSMAAVREGEEGEDHQWPERTWQCEVLNRVLSSIDSSRSETELLNLAATEWCNHPGSATFQSRAEAVVGEITNANRSLRKSVHKLIREGVV